MEILLNPNLKVSYAPQNDQSFAKSSPEIDIRTQSKVAFLANFVKILRFFWQFFMIVTQNVFPMILKNQFSQKNITYRALH